VAVADNVITIDGSSWSAASNTVVVNGKSYSHTTTAGDDAAREVSVQAIAAEIVSDLGFGAVESAEASGDEDGTVTITIAAADVAASLKTQLDANGSFAAQYTATRNSGALTIANKVLAPTLDTLSAGLSLSENQITVTAEDDDTTYSFNLDGKTVSVTKLDADGFEETVTGSAALIEAKIAEMGINVNVSRSGAVLTFSKGGAVNVSTAENASASIDRIDSAIKVLNEQRASLGAISNRLDSTVSNLTNISSNLQAGRGRIEDADFAAETTSLAKSQILQQASTAMLAQANASKQNVLSLLQG